MTRVRRRSRAPIYVALGAVAWIVGVVVLAFASFQDTVPVVVPPAKPGQAAVQSPGDVTYECAAVLGSGAPRRLSPAAVAPAQLDRAPCASPRAQRRLLLVVDVVITVAVGVLAVVMRQRRRRTDPGALTTPSGPMRAPAASPS